jgi:hypothetical protein
LLDVLEAQWRQHVQVQSQLAETGSVHEMSRCSNSTIVVDRRGFPAQAIVDDFRIEVGQCDVALADYQERLKALAWHCLKVLWVKHYSFIRPLQPMYTMYEQFASDVQALLIRPRFQHIKIHFKRSSLLYKLCVSGEQSPRVLGRQGFHSSDGHSVSIFFGENGVIRVKCFDAECSEKCSSYLGDALPFRLRDEYVSEGIALFKAMLGAYV